VSGAHSSGERTAEWTKLKEPYLSRLQPPVACMGTSVALMFADILQGLSCLE
jgi:hypothetical protein